MSRAADRGRKMRFTTVARRTIEDYGRKHMSARAAALSFYMIFSLGPTVIVAFWLASFFVEPGLVEEELRARLSDLVGASGAEAAWRLAESAELARGQPVLNVLGAVVLLFTASRVMAHVQESLNVVWDIPHGKGMKRLILKRLTSFLALFVIGLVLILSLVLNAVISAFTDLLRQWIPISPWLVYVGVNLVSVLIIILLFAMLFVLLPDRRIPWRYVWLGATVSTVLFVVGKFVVGIYLGTRDMGTAYGAAASLVLVLLWAYYSAQTFFLGAVFTRQVAEEGPPPGGSRPAE